MITGAEIVDNWEHLEGDVWTARVSNGLFGDYNPYTTLVSGDWFIASYTAHTGEVYLNGKSMYEVTSLDQVKKPEIYKKSWDQAFTVYTWYVEQDEEKNETVFYVISRGKTRMRKRWKLMCARIAFIHRRRHRLYHAVRLCCKTGGNPVAPPTAYQEGMVGPHWSKGWIIEDCEISDSKCSGISLGNTDSRTMTINGSNGNSKMVHRRSVTVSARRSGRDGQRKTSEATSSAGATSTTVDRRVL